MRINQNVFRNEISPWSWVWITLTLNATLGVLASGDIYSMMFQAGCVICFVLKAFEQSMHEGTEEIAKIQWELTKFWLFTGFLMCMNLYMNGL